MLLEELNTVVARIAESYTADEAREIKKEYQNLSGAIFDDDRSYEARLACFLEWFILERTIPDSTETAMEKFIRTNRDGIAANTLKSYQDFTETIHGIFIVKKVAPEMVTVLSLFDDRKYKVHETGGKSIFQKNDIFEGRIVSSSGQNIFTGSFVFHPPKSTKFIKSAGKLLRKEQKSAYDELAKLYRILKSLGIDNNSVTADIAKIKSKILKTNSENKRLSLEEKLASAVNTLSAIADEQTLMKIRTTAWENEKIKIGCREQCFQLVQKFSYMSLKWERSRQIDVKDIYKN